MKRILIAAAALSMFAVEAWAQGRDIGYRVTCLRNNDYCTVERIRVVEGTMQWNRGVYVEGDGDLGRFPAASQADCERLCSARNRCVMAEFYFGRDAPRPVCNLFSNMRQLKWNESGDATVGVWR